MPNEIAGKYETDPWGGKAGRYHAILVVALVIFTAFATYDGKGFYTRYMGLCTEQPERAECKPLNLIRKERQVDPGITLEHGKGKWALEVGSGLSEAEANDLAIQLQSSRIQSRISKLSRGTTTLYQVQIGRFPMRKNATEVGTQLQAKGFISRFILVGYK
jgi:hypothetical protein